MVCCFGWVPGFEFTGFLLLQTTTYASVLAGVCACVFLSLAGKILQTQKCRLRGLRLNENTEPYTFRYGP